MHMTEPAVESRIIRRRTSRVVLVLVALLVAAAFAVGYYLAYVKVPLSANQQLNQEVVSRTVGLMDASPLRMDEALKDQNDDGVAYPPIDPAAQLNPSKLFFSYVPIERREQYPEAFAEFVAHLSKATGKPVEYAVFKSPG